MIRNGTALVEASWDQAMDLITSRSRELLDSKGAAVPCLLHLGSAEARGVLHAGGHRQGRDRNAPYGRQHPAVHCDGCRVVEESFGADGQPGSYADLDFCETLFCFSHNVAATQTVLWSRILDRLAGSESLRLVAVDPRQTPVAK